MSNNKIMRSNSHSGDENQGTWISIIVNAVNQWKRQNDWSRETVADQIVESHVNNSSHLVTGINFEMQGSGDEYRRQHSNANKIFRWLDELTKDNNLLPANFIKSILKAMPMPLRLKTVNTLLMGLELSVKPICQVEHIEPLEMLRHILHETSEVNNAYAQLVDGIDPGELEDALETSINAIATLNKAKSVIENMLLERSNGTK